MMSESAEVLSAVVLREGGTRATVGERGTIVVRADAGWVAPCEGVEDGATVAGSQGVIGAGKHVRRHA